MSDHVEVLKRHGLSVTQRNVAHKMRLGSQLRATDSAAEDILGMALKKGRWVICKFIETPSVRRARRAKKDEKR